MDSGHNAAAAFNMKTANADFRKQSEGSISSLRTNGVAPAASFSFRPPEPPNIIVPQPPTNNDFSMVVPTFNGLGGDDITDVELGIITQTKFHPIDNSANWRYEWRRKAQKILPFLYLGPWEVLRTQTDFVRNEEITLLLVVRDKATAEAGIMNPQKYAEQFGIMYDSIDVQDNQELITAFPRAVKVINDHLINCYRQQVQTTGNMSLTSGPPPPLRMGKIFAFCETGNMRSAAVAAAYVLAMYKISLIECLGFIQAQRFCIAFDEPMKNLLRSYEDILVAQRDVRKARYEARKNMVPISNGREMGFEGNNTKRGRSIDEDEDVVMGGDIERFEGRVPFQPFLQEY